jgi:hypothetical protein
MQNTNRRLHENTLEEEQVVSQPLLAFFGGVLTTTVFGSLCSSDGGARSRRSHETTFGGCHRPDS